jgi:hypothetical protein
VKETINDISNGNGFYGQLLKKVLLTTMAVIAISLSYLFWVQVDGNGLWQPILIVALALIKTIFIVRLTFIQLAKIIGESHQLAHVLTLFAVLIVSIFFFSLTADYHALYTFDP